MVGVQRLLPLSSALTLFSIQSPLSSRLFTSSPFAEQGQTTGDLDAQGPDFLVQYFLILLYGLCHIFIKTFITCPRLIINIKDLSSKVL